MASRRIMNVTIFSLFGNNRDDADYILETFPVVTRRDIQKHGSYRTKEIILDIYDRIKCGMNIGKPYKVSLDSSPGDFQCKIRGHPIRLRIMIWSD